MVQPYQASIAEYCYSDVSEAFLRYGQQRYAAKHPYLTYQIFNVEKPLAGQGIQLERYDLVIASNVLHATSSIRCTVRNAKAALKKHGLLLLNEITGTSLFSHLTIGLLEGWWAYEDPELRIPGCPALTAESWQAVLNSEGFGVIYHPTREMQEASQQVIVAESDGVVRQPPTEQSLRLLSKAAKAPIEAAPNCREGSCAPPSTDPGSEVWLDRLREALTHMVSHFLKVPVERIDAEVELSKYGFDSIAFTKLADRLNQTYQLDLTPAHFYEHSTLERLAQYLQTTYADVLVPHFASASSEVVTRKDFAPEEVTIDEVSPLKASPQLRTRIVREAVWGNRVLFLKVYNGEH